MPRITIKVSDSAECALCLDDRAAWPDLEWPKPGHVSMTVEDARKMLGEAEARGWGGGWDPEFWRQVRPCRAVAKRLRAALAELEG